jgi:hypothetical protein
MFIAGSPTKSPGHQLKSEGIFHYEDLLVAGLALMGDRAAVSALGKGFSAATMVLKFTGLRRWNSHGRPPHEQGTTENVRRSNDPKVCRPLILAATIFAVGTVSREGLCGYGMNSGDLVSFFFAYKIKQ